MNTPEVTNHYRLVEPRSDAIWRRTVLPITRIDNPALEWLGVILLILILPALLKQPARLCITDHTRKDLGFVTFPSAAMKPREHFSIYLDHEDYPLTNTPLALAAIAIPQALR